MVSAWKRSKGSVENHKNVVSVFHWFFYIAKRGNGEWILHNNANPETLKNIVLNKKRKLQRATLKVIGVQNLMEVWPTIFKIYYYYQSVEQTD